MTKQLIFALTLLAGLAGGVIAEAQATDIRGSRASVVPNLVKFSGMARDMRGDALTGVLGVTFALYQAEQGGSALWRETQNVTADKNGQFSVSLGATVAEGIPAELFVNGDARWLSVQVEGQPEERRILLLSVPYAMKAGDAETLGGLPASAFALAGHGATTEAASNSVLNPAATPTGAGTTNYVPLWTAAGTLGNSNLFQLGTGATGMLGLNTTTPASTLDVNGASTLRGAVSLPSATAATALVGAFSQPLNLTASAFNSTTSLPIAQSFQWKAEPVGNNTTAPSGSMNLLYGAGATAPVETGFRIGSNGLVTFKAGQTFPGTGPGTITGVTAGTGLTGGGVAGKVTVNVDTTKVPLLATANTFTQPITFAATQKFPGTVTSVAPGTGLTVSTSGAGGKVTVAVNSALVPLLNNANTFTQSQTIQAGAGGLTVVSSGTGVQGTGAVGVYGATTVAGGYSDGVLGHSTNATAIRGDDTAGGSGAVGTSSSGFGVYGLSSTGNGVYGTAGTGSGIPVNNVSGVVGDSSTQNGVTGLSTTGAGMVAINRKANSGLAAVNQGSGFGIYATASTVDKDYGVGIRGESFGTQVSGFGGPDGVQGITHSSLGSGVAGINDAPGGYGVTGVSTNNGFGFNSPSNVTQARGMGGWVKAMIYVDPFVPGGIAITRCYNSQATGAAVYTPPCGISINHVAQGGNVVDFGFLVSDRFVNTTCHYQFCFTETLYQGPQSLYITSGNQLQVDTRDISNSNTVMDAPFTVLIY